MMYRTLELFSSAVIGTIGMGIRVVLILCLFIILTFKFLSNAIKKATA
jgi:hypothetical protein